MRNLRKALGAWLLVASLLLGMMPVSFAADAYSVTASITPSSGINAGDTVRITAQVFQGGTEITDLDSAGLQL